MASWIATCWRCSIARFDAFSEATVASPRSVPRSMKRGALLAAKVGVSLALLIYLFSTTDLSALESRVRSGDVLLFATAVALYAGMLALSTWRWRLLLHALGFPARLRDLTSSYLVATFFNNFLPSNIGGDVVRVRDGSRLTGSTAASLMVPLCTLLQTVPITFNGWGLRESLFVVYFAQVGLPRDNALAFSLVGASLIVVLSLSGAVVWMSRDNAPAANPVT